MAFIGVVLIIGGVSAALAVVFLAIGLIRKHMVRDWVSTTGMVVGRPGFAGLPATYPTFRWRDRSGREHEYTSWVRSSFPPRPGSLVEVKYDPDHPNRAMMTGIAQSGLIFVIIGAVLGVLAVAMLAVTLVLVFL